MSQGGNEVVTTTMVNNKYRITRRIGGGSFGEIYMGIGPTNEKVIITQVIIYFDTPPQFNLSKWYRLLLNLKGREQDVPN